MYNVYFIDKFGKHLVQRTNDLMEARSTEEWIRNELKTLDPDFVEHNAFTTNDEEEAAVEIAKARWDALTDEEKKTFIIVDGKKYVKAVYEATHPMTAKDIRALSGLNKTNFCKKYEIPARTWDSWESGERQPAPYILKLLERVVKEDKR